MNLTLPENLVESIPQLSGAAIKTYLALVLVKAAVKRYPTQEDLAAYMNASPRSVFKYLYELEKAGYIVKRRVGAGMKTDYVLLTEPTYGAQ
jgi:Mn-dependent DtxR family transcriptional regulator